MAADMVFALLGAVLSVFSMVSLPLGRIGWPKVRLREILCGCWEPVCLILGSGDSYVGKDGCRGLPSLSWAPIWSGEVFNLETTWIL